MNDKMKLTLLIRAFQVRGHEVAKLDPLDLANRDSVPELDYKAYGFTDADLDKTFDMSGVPEAVTVGEACLLLAGSLFLTLLRIGRVSLAATVEPPALCASC